ncbi:RagB/SusD family nutrient uptake outer membrane protein [Bacteroides fragilis]|nr:RagB/SusD family nutrient uptake outer membrane protein [Bacteroides fragilis]
MIYWVISIDFYGSGSYWTTEAQVTGYMDGLHKHLRDVAEQHIFTFGELRGGIYKSESNTSSGESVIGASVY